MVKIQIEKIKSTCIILDSILYKPVKTKDSVDFYEIPCALNKLLNIQIVHYSDVCTESVCAVIDYKDNKYSSIIKEMKSLNISLYYCKLTAEIYVTKANSFLSVCTKENKSKDIIGCSSYYSLNIIQRKNVFIDNFRVQYYPSKKIKYTIFFVEIFLQLIGFIVFFTATIINGVYCIKYWNNPSLYIGPYPFFLTVIPMLIASLVLILLEIKRVAKYTLAIR